MTAPAKPKVDEAALRLESDFAAAAANSIAEDTTLEAVLIQGGEWNKQDFSGLHLSRVVFSGCRFTACSFKRCSFSDVVFRSCDLSASSFADGSMARCEIRDSKAMGTLLCDTYLRDLQLDGVKAHYLNLAKSRVFFARFAGCSFLSADFTDCELKALALERCDFTGASFYRTPLKGIDLRGSTLAALGVQLDCPELKGAVLDFTQLADLADMLGITLR